MRALGPALVGAALLGLALALTVASVWVVRTVPVLGHYGETCGTPEGLCVKPVKVGGFPLPYLYDSFGVSVQDQVSWGEDRLHRGPFWADVAAFYALALALVTWQRRAARHDRARRYALGALATGTAAAVAVSMAAIYASEATLGAALSVAARWIVLAPATLLVAVIEALPLPWPAALWAAGALLAVTLGAALTLAVGHLRRRPRRGTAAAGAPPIRPGRR